MLIFRIQRKVTVRGSTQIGSGGATTLSITILSITTLSIIGLVMTLSINILHNSSECHYAECRDYLKVMLSVVRLNVIMLSVVAPLRPYSPRPS